MSEPTGSPEPPPSGIPTRSRPARTEWIIGGALLLVVVGGFAMPSLETSPEGVVEDFFTALQDKDVEGALDQVASDDIPYGAKAVFLHPDAIADGWELVEATIGDGADSFGERRVDVTVSVGGDIETGSVTVDEYQDEWKLADPFVLVSFETPTDYLRVNDRTVVPRDLPATNVVGSELGASYPVFPGPAEFFADLAGTTTEPAPVRVLWPSGDLSHETIRPPTLELTDQVQAAGQDAVDRILDDCARFRVSLPVNCPFQGEYVFREDGTDIQIVDPYDVSWAVESYPEVTLVDSDGADRINGLGVDVVEPGVITLTESGTIGTGQVDIEAECGVDASGISVTLTSDGGVRAVSTWQMQDTTCTITDRTEK